MKLTVDTLRQIINNKDKTMFSSCSAIMLLKNEISNMTIIVDKSQWLTIDKKNRLNYFLKQMLKNISDFELYISKNTLTDKALKKFKNTINGNINAFEVILSL